MKKMIVGVLAASLLAAMSVTALAEPIEGVGQTANHEVTGTYQQGSAEKVYSVDVEWGSMNFTYTEGSKGTWNPATHAYDGAADAAWSWKADANKITVTNHSNAEVKAKLAYTSNKGVEGGFYNASTEGATIAENTLSLATAEGTAVGAAPSASAYLQITEGSITEGGSFGSVTVTLE